MTTSSSPPAKFPEERPVVEGATIARNTALNLIGLGLPLIAAVLAVPYVVPRLGVDRFGILSLAWVLFSYLTIFDLGLGWAATKFVAECLGRNERQRIAGLVWTTLTVQTLLGVLGAALTTLLLPLLVYRLLNIPDALKSETHRSLLILTWALPIAVGTTTLRGVLEAKQRFDLVTWVRVPASSSLYLLPALGVSLGLHLPGIVALLVGQIVATAFAYGWMCLKLIPEMRRYEFRSDALRPVAVFGGWVTLSNLVAPMLVSLDRFVIGARLPVASVAYYSVPWDLIMRVQVIPNSLASALFPAFSTLSASSGGEKLAQFYVRGIKFLVLLLAPALLLVAIFAHPLMTIWMGAEFATNSAPVLQILTVGILTASLAFIPSVALQAAGSPDLPAKFHLIQVPFYIAILWVLVGLGGTVGAALACAIRMIADAALLFGATYHMWASARRAAWPIAGVLIVTSSTVWAIINFRIQTGLYGGLALLPCLMILYIWRAVLDADDRTSLVATATRLLGFGKTSRNRLVSTNGSGG